MSNVAACFGKFFTAFENGFHFGNLQPAKKLSGWILLSTDSNSTSLLNANYTQTARAKQNTFDDFDFFLHAG